MRIGRRHASCSLLSAERSTWMNLSAAVGRPGGASIVVVALVVSRQRPALAGRVVEVEPGGAVALRRRRHVGGYGGILERESIVLEARRDDGIDGGQITSAGSCRAV